MNNQQETLEKLKKEVEEERNYYRVISLESLYGMHFPDNAWTIKGMIPSEGITIVSGSPSSYKTWITFLMALAIAKGEEFLGLMETQQGKILIIDEENHLREIKRRMELLGGEKELPVSFLSQEGFLVRNEVARKKVLKICEEQEITTLFIDSLVRVNDADENVSSQMSPFFKDLKEFCKAGITVVLIHHERKEGLTKGSVQSRLRGSSDILAAVDSHISIRKDKDNNNIIVVEQSKLRAGKELEPFEIIVSDLEGKVEFEHMGSHMGFESKEVIASSFIVDILLENSEGLNVNAIVEAVRSLMEVSDKTVRNALKKLIKDGTVAEKQGQKNEKICYLPPDSPKVVKKPTPIGNDILPV